MALTSPDEARSVASGLQLEPDDLAKVRHLLSDYSAISFPEVAALRPPWNHEKTFQALVRRGDYKEPWKKNIYARLYPQKPNCAVLYGPKVSRTQRGPLHLNPLRNSWDSERFQRMAPFIEYVQSDNKGPGKETSNFAWYRVRDWDGFAASLGL
jgi:hypothetical protein